MKFIGIIISYIEKYYINLSLPSLVFTEVFFIVSVILIFGNLKITKDNWFYAICLFVLNYLAIFIPLVVVKSFINYYGLNMTYTFITFLFIYALLNSIRIKRYTTNIFYAFFFSTIYIFLTNIGKSTTGFIYNYMLGMQYQSADLQLTISIVSGVVLVFMVLLIKIFPLNKYVEVHRPMVIISIVIFAIAVVAKILVDFIKEENMPFYGSNEENNAIFILFTGILIYVLNLISYVFVYIESKIFARNKSLTKNIEGINKQNNKISSLEANLNTTLDQMRQMKHDIENQVTYINLIMANGDKSELNDYLAEFKDNIKNATNFADCANKCIRDVLNIEINKCKINGIYLDSKISVGEKIGIKEFDLINLLMNLLDNAIDAIKLDNIKEGKIDCEIKQDAGCLFVKVSNPISNRLNEKQRKNLESTKEDKKYHGIGTKIIKDVVKRYDGTFEYEVTHESFTCSLMLMEGSEK